MTCSRPAPPTPNASPSSVPGAPNEVQVQMEAEIEIAHKRGRRKRMSTPKPKKPKVRTYIRRRTEIEELRDEMERLKKQRAFYEYRNDQLRLLERDAENKTLRDALYVQRLSFASTTSMFTQFYRDNATKPFDLPARLGSNLQEREAALLKMKNDRLEVAHNWMLQREHHTMTSEFCDRKRFEATNGDFVSVRFEVIPLPGARSIKTIIDALQNFVYNLEISVSEAIGDISVRENDDAIPGSPVAQHRLVATIADVVQTDVNNVAFAEYRPAGPPGSGERELGIMVGDTVDEDELYPYHPEARIRQDMTLITNLMWHEGDDGKPIVVMIRWWCLRLRKSFIYVPPIVVDRICSGFEKVAESMLVTARRASGSPR